MYFVSTTWQIIQQMKNSMKRQINVDDQAKCIVITAARLIRGEIRNLNFHQTAMGHPHETQAQKSSKLEATNVVEFGVAQMLLASLYGFGSSCLFLAGFKGEFICVFYVF